LQPRLLSEMGVIDSVTPVKVQSDFAQPGTRLESAGVRWTIRPERLSIETSSPEQDCGQLMSSVLEHLKWTPVWAIGCNVEFQCAEPIEGDLPVSFRLPMTSRPSVQRTSHIAFNDGEDVVNLQLSFVENRLDLTANVHSDYGPLRFKMKQSQLNDMAVESCRLFLKKRKLAVQLAEEVTNAKFTYEHANV